MLAWIDHLSVEDLHRIGSDFDKAGGMRGKSALRPGVRRQPGLTRLSDRRILHYTDRPPLSSRNLGLTPGSTPPSAGRLLPYRPRHLEIGMSDAQNDEEADLLQHRPVFARHDPSHGLVLVDLRALLLSSDRGPFPRTARRQGQEVRGAKHSA